MPLQVLRKSTRSVLRVYARGEAMVCDHERLDHPTMPTRGFVGRVFDRELADETNSGGWRPILDPHEVPVRAEYLMALLDKDLWPADEETAKRAGVPFDPTFGGEIEEVRVYLEERKAAKELAAKTKTDAESAAALKASQPAPKAVAAPPVPPAAPDPEHTTDHHTQEG